MLVRSLAHPIAVFSSMFHILFRKDAKLFNFILPDKLLSRCCACYKWMDMWVWDICRKRIVQCSCTHIYCSCLNVWVYQVTHSQTREVSFKYNTYAHTKIHTLNSNPTAFLALNFKCFDERYAHIHTQLFGKQDYMYTQSLV